LTATHKHVYFLTMKQYYLYTLSRNLNITDHGLTKISKRGIIKSGVNKGLPIEDCCAGYAAYDKPQKEEDVWSDFLDMIDD